MYLDKETLVLSASHYTATIIDRSHSMLAMMGYCSLALQQAAAVRDTTYACMQEEYSIEIYRGYE